MKKTIYFGLLTFLIAFGISESYSVSAQGNENTALVDRTFPMITTEAYLTDARKIPVECDGVVIDHLSGTLDVFCRMFGHFNPLNPNVFITLWMIHNYSGSLTGEHNEVFEIQGARKIDSVDKVYTWHLNIKGDLGSHYILFATGTTNPTYTFTIEKAVCPSGTDQ